MRSFAEEIRRWFGRSGMTQAELADRLGVKRTAVTQQLGGKIRFGADRLISLFKALRIPNGDRPRLCRLYLADSSPAALRSEAEAMVASADSLASGLWLAERLLAAERAFDAVRGKGAAGAKRGFLYMVMQLETAMGAIDARSAKAYSKRIDNMAGVELARFAAELAVRLFRPTRGSRAEEARGRLAELLKKESVKHYVEFARQTVLGFEKGS